MTTPNVKTFSQMDLDQARADGEKAGAALAYARISTVLADPRIKGREKAATTLACKSSTMSADDVCTYVAGGWEGTPDFTMRMKQRHGA